MVGQGFDMRGMMHGCGAGARMCGGAEVAVQIPFSNGRALAKRGRKLNMPHRSRPHNGIVRKASQRIPFLLPDGSEIEAVWGGTAQNEMVDSCLGKSGYELAQSGEIEAAAGSDDESNEVRRGATATSGGAGLFFVVEPEGTGKDGQPYRPGRMVTREATPEQEAYFRDARFALLGIMNPDGSISIIEPLTPPAPEPPAKGELF